MCLWDCCGGGGREGGGGVGGGGMDVDSTLEAVGERTDGREGKGGL